MSDRGGQKITALPPVDKNVLLASAIKSRLFLAFDSHFILSTSPSGQTTECVIGVEGVRYSSRGRCGHPKPLGISFQEMKETDHVARMSRMKWSKTKQQPGRGTGD